MGVSEGKISGRARRIDGCRPDDITAFKRTMALSGLSRLLQSRLGERGEAAAAAKDCASFASACCSERLWCCSGVSKDPCNACMTKKVQEHHDLLKNTYENQEQPSSSCRQLGRWLRALLQPLRPPPSSAGGGAVKSRKMKMHLFQATAPRDVLGIVLHIGTTWKTPRL